MKQEEKLSLDEFVTAPRKPVTNRLTVPTGESPVGSPVEPAEIRQRSLGPPAEPDDEKALSRLEARKALRRVKRDRMDGVQNFVNVHLDRATKKRLKLASFTSEISMQSIMEKAIIGYLDENRF
jgi:hypothetical protein